MIDWNKRNGGFLSTESVYEDQLGNLSMQINQKDKEIERLNNIIDELEKDMRKMIDFLKSSNYHKIDTLYIIETLDIYCDRLKEGK